jgi:hypothetical protein
MDAPTSPVIKEVNFVVTEGFLMAKGNPEVWAVF